MIEWAGASYALAKELYGFVKDAKELYETGKGVHDALKEVTEHMDVKEVEPMLVDFDWPEKSGFTAKAAQDGYDVAWSRPDRVASRAGDGYEVMFEVDTAANTKRRIVLYDGLVLIGRKRSGEAVAG